MKSGGTTREITAEVVERFHAQLEPPTRDEGFADVKTVLEFSA